MAEPTSRARSMRLDHAVILVADLERAIADYQALGFTVTSGGTHNGRATRNALIAFADDTYLELLTFARRTVMRLLPLLSPLGLGGLLGTARTPLEERFRSRAMNGPGLIDFALLPPSLEAELSRLRREGIPTDGPIPGGRSTASGESVEWELALPGARELPFLCKDLTAHELRVPAGQAREHANGVVGIDRVVIAVASLERSSARFRAVLGIEPDPAPATVTGDGRGRVFKLDGCELVVASATAAANPLRQHLRRYGEGVFSLRLRAPGAGDRGMLDRSRTHGARLDLIG